MNKELCFSIEGENLYLEQVLVDYMDIPIFFLCVGENRYYIALCRDINELNYVVVRLSERDVYDLLHGKIPMRDVILKQTEYWDIVSGDEICMDKVTLNCIDVLEQDVLPEEHACFRILTKQVQEYVDKFDYEFLAEKHFLQSDRKADLQEDFDRWPLFSFFDNIDFFTELAEFNMEEPALSVGVSYHETMNMIKESEFTFENFKKLNSMEIDDLYNLADPSANNIAVAA